MKLLVPILAVVLGVAFAIAIALRGPSPTPPATPPSADPPAAIVAGDGVSGDEAPPSPSASVVQPGDTAPAPTNTAAPSTEGTAPAAATPMQGLRALPASSPVAPALGSDDPATDFKVRVEFTSYGAGIRKVTLADYAQYVDPPAPGKPRVPYHLVDVADGLAQGASPAFYPFAARSVTINGSTVPLEGVQWTADLVDSQGAAQSVTYRVPIVSADGEPVAEVVRTWSLAPGSYDLQLNQRVVNQSGQPLEVSFEQYGQGDVVTEPGDYLGDRRMFITGHFRPETPPKFAVYVDDSYITRAELLKQNRTIWPNDQLKPGATLAWLASENRYFAVITHAPIPQGATQTADVPELTRVFPSLGYRVMDRRVDTAHTDAKAVAVTMSSGKLTLPAEGSASLDLAVFAGPRDSTLLEQSPYNLMHLDKLIRYELGCTWCTFQWLAHLLLGYLKALHWLVADWGVAIIILVLTVRLILHPITKKSQVNMMKMSKQMASLQPEVQKLKEKYKNDAAAMNREMMALYREKGINPANMLGCLPMLLQTPIWIALYAMLYFAIELRHQPAFYGIFQAISSGGWHFLQDLSVSDNFIRFIKPEDPAFKITWLPLIQPEFRSINILPLLMGVVFYFQMKLTTPPPQNEQQKQQQAIMKFMPFIFPVMLYSAPAGLTLYICCSTLAGIVDSYIVRKHVREQEASGQLFAKKEIKPGSWRDKLQQRVELAQKMAMEKQEEMQRSKQGGNKQFKKRK